MLLLQHKCWLSKTVSNNFDQKSRPRIPQLCTTMSEHKDMTNRHLRHKLQSLGRRLDELEEATTKLQKSEDELVELQVSTLIRKHKKSLGRTQRITDWIWF